MNGNRIKQIKMSKAKLENVVEKGLKSNTWTRPHNPSGPHDESKRGGRPILGQDYMHYWSVQKVVLGHLFRCPPESFGARVFLL